MKKSQKIILNTYLILGFLVAFMGAGNGAEPSEIVIGWIALAMLFGSFWVFTIEGKAPPKI